MWKYFAAWFPMVLIGIANGVLREATYGKHLGELQAHQTSTVSAVVLFGIYIYIVVRIWTLQSPVQAFIVGLMWLALTVAFEFIFGRWVAGHSWSWLLHDYNVFAGRVWVFVPIWVTIAPYVFYRLQQ